MGSAIPRIDRVRSCKGTLTPVGWGRKADVDFMNTSTWCFVPGTFGCETKYQVQSTKHKVHLLRNASRDNFPFLPEVPRSKSAGPGILSPLRHQVDDCSAAAICSPRSPLNHSARRASPRAGDHAGEHAGSSGGEAGTVAEAFVAAFGNRLQQPRSGQKPD